MCVKRATGSGNQAFDEVDQNKPSDTFEAAKRRQHLAKRVIRIAATDNGANDERNKHRLGKTPSTKHARVYIRAW